MATPEANHQDLWTRYLNSRIANIQGVSPRDHPDVIQLARQKIDDEVAVLVAAVSSLRTRRNALTRICTLPSEVLGRIFHFHAAGDPPNRAKNLGWIRATQVCRVWRDTALQHPSLWSDVTDKLGYEWTREMVARAKSAPLSYSQCFYQPWGPPGHIIASLVIPQQLSHIRHLSIAEGTGAMGAILLSLVASPAPMLESLYLHDGRGTCTFPRDVSHSHFPLLRRLELCDIQLSWTAPILRGLIHLDINNIESYSLHRSARSGDMNVYTQFFCALQEMSSLETLSLLYCLPIEPRDPPSIPHVVLPRLQQLTLGDSATVECKSALKHLAIPPSCDITVDCGTLVTRHFPGIMTFVKAHILSGAHENSPLTMLVSNAQGSDTGARWLLRFWAAGESPSPAGHRQEGEGVPAISILIDADANVEDVCHALANDAWAIRDLILESDNIDWTLSPEEWIYAFEGYTEMANVSVRGQVARSLCGALDVPPPHLAHDQQDESGDGGQLGQQVFLFRKLSRVEIKYVKFEIDDEGELSEGDEGFPTATISIFDMLKTSLAHRRAAANISLKLYLRGCTIDLDQLRELRGIVEVVWDLFGGSDDNSAYYNRLL